MILRIIRRFTCKHAWKSTYIGLGDRTYTCVRCGNAAKVFTWNNGKWRIRQELRGGSVHD